MVQWPWIAAFAGMTQLQGNEIRVDADFALD
jgi:hypothetical protein